jgi:1-aminocyclopropane-1-carboxylate deaminase/D-cysteine desulfhydrase-like pyridoxal-dependent ACC family enzyme
MRSSIKDDALGDEVEAIEREESPTAEESRTRIKAAVEERYTMPAEGAEAADLGR